MLHCGWGVAGVALLAGYANAAGARPPAQVDAAQSVATRTVAEELLAMETRARKLPPDRARLLDAILRDAVAAADGSAPPETREKALDVLEAVQTSLARHNLVQPGSKKDWTETMGEALTPLVLDPSDRQRIVQSAENRTRAPFIDPDEPLYYFDCDMGAQIFISVGQRLGWDIRLVEVPSHNFVRWHLPGMEPVNWDWTSGDSTDDALYETRIPRNTTARLRRTYMRSQPPEEMRAYYMVLIASNSDDHVEAERIFVEAEEVMPDRPMPLNNRGWHYATHPDLPSPERKKAVEYALAGWAFEPTNENFIDTVACAYAAGGQWALARALRDHALSLAQGTEHLDAIKENRASIEKEQLCNP